MNIIYQGRTKKIENGLTVKEALKKEINENKYEVIGCLYNNDYRNLETEVEEGARIELIDISSKEGMKIYVRTIVYIMGKAFENLYNREKIMVEYQLGNAMYCKCDNIQITDEFITKLKNEMQKIIEKDEKITKVEMTRKEAEKFYEENNSSRGRLQFDLKGNKLAECEYSSIDALKGTTNSLITKKDEKYGLLDNTGATILSNEYKSIKPISDKYENGYIVQNESGKYGVINWNKTVAVDTKYDDVKQLYSNGNYYVVKENGKWKIVDTVGGSYLAGEYDDITAIDGDYIVAKKSNKYDRRFHLR